MRSWMSVASAGSGGGIMSFGGIMDHIRSIEAVAHAGTPPARGQGSTQQRTVSLVCAWQELD
jgi:hypothetical protein